MIFFVFASIHCGGVPIEPRQTEDTSTKFCGQSDQGHASVLRDHREGGGAESWDELVGREDGHQKTGCKNWNSDRFHQRF